MPSEKPAQLSWAPFKTAEFGVGLVLCRGKAVARVWLPTQKRNAGSCLDELRWIEDAIPEAPGGYAGAVARRLEALFSRAEDVSDIPVLIEGLRPFTRRVAEECRRIPRGETRSYQDLAALSGSPGASRAVGTAMATNRLPFLIPCHRVVRSDSLGNYGGGVEMKRHLLAQERHNSEGRRQK